MTSHGPSAFEGFFDARKEGQVYARDVEAALQTSLIYIPPRGAEAFREGARGGRYVCVLPTCAAPLTAVAPSVRRHHFRHRAGGARGGHGPEAVWHLAAKDLVAGWARRQQPTAEVDVDTRRTASGAQPDVWARWSSPFPEGNVAFEVQYSPLTATAYRQRVERYRSDAIRDVWLFGHAEPHAIRVKDRWALTETLREVLRCGEQILWINPDERTLASAFVVQREQMEARPGEYWPGGLPSLEFARPPRPDDELVDVGTDSLDDCILQASGLLTKTLVWVAEQSATRAEMEDSLRAAAREAESVRRHEKPQKTTWRGHAGVVDAPHKQALPVAEPVDLQRRHPTPGGENGSKPRPCPHCGGVTQPKQEWPYWYRVPEHVREVWSCTGCELVLGDWS